MNISISNTAYRNLYNIAKFTLQVSANYSNYIIYELYSTIDSIKNFPYIGRYVPEILNTNYRERICKNYRIIYFISQQSNTIYIRYVISVKQNSNLFFKIHKKELLDFLNTFI